MNNIKVSVIVPVYNCEKYLKKCLDSLVNQTLKDIEIICVNDGSTDNSGRILEEYNDKRIKIINKENGGQSSARNIGIDIAKGEYIGFVDSDDWVDLDFFEKLYNTAKKYDADIAVTGIIRMRPSETGRYLMVIDKETVSDDYFTKLRLSDIPDKSYIWNKIYKTAELKKYNLKFPEGKIYEDIYLVPRMLYYLKTLATVPDTYYYYLRRKGSTVTSKTPETIRDYMWAKKEARHFAKEHGVNLYNLQTITKKFKFFGVTIFKVTKKLNKKTYRLFNIIKWHTQTA